MPKAASCRGEIHATSSLVNEGLDGDHASHEVAVTAEPRSSSGLAGTIEVSRTYVNGQGEALDEDYEPSVCRSRLHQLDRHP